MRTSLSVRITRRLTEFVLGLALVTAVLFTAGIARASDDDNDRSESESSNVDIDVSSVSTVHSELRNKVDVSAVNMVDASSYSEGGSAESTIEEGAISTTGGTGGAGGDSSVGAITIEAPQQRGSITIRNTPAALAPNIYASGPCFKGASGAASGPGFGLSIGGGRIDPGCVEREEIRIAAQIGLTSRALFRWCGLDNNVEEFGSREDCLSFGPKETEVEYTTNSEPEPQVDYLLAEVTEKEYKDQVEETEAVQVQQQVTITSLMDRLLKAEFEEGERKAADQRRAQQIEEYKAKWAEPEPGDGG